MLSLDFLLHLKCMNNWEGEEMRWDSFRRWMVQAKISNLQTQLLNGTLAHSPHEIVCFRLFNAVKTLDLRCWVAITALASSNICKNVNEDISVLLSYKWMQCRVGELQLSRCQCVWLCVWKREIFKLSCWGKCGRHSLLPSPWKPHLFCRQRGRESRCSESVWELFHIV